MTTYTVANLKGGTAKSTSSAFLAHAIEAKNRSVLGIDADPPGSLLRWSELGDWKLPVIGMPTKDIHTRLPGVARGYDDTVIDTPPLEDQAGIVRSALRAADVVVVPIAPSTIELDRVTPILDVVDEVNTLRETPLVVWVLLTRVDGRAASGKSARNAFVADGFDVVPTAIPMLQRYALAFPKPITITPGEPYALALDDMLNTTKAA